MDYTLYELALLFFIYAFLGWCGEVAFAAIKTGKFVNRGFLNGPVCPIYGFGVVICIVVLTPISGSLPVLFFGSMVLASALEFLTGWALEMLFHAKWWDYSSRRFNLKGYICLEFSIMWGVAATFVLRLVHPAILRLVRLLPRTAGIVILIVLLVLIAVDLGATIAVVHNLQKRLQLLTRLAGGIRDLSDSLGDSISDAALSVKSRTDETQERYRNLTEMMRIHRAEEKALAEAHRAQEQILWNAAREQGRAARAERSEELRAKLSKQIRLHNRILRAFPSLQSDENQAALDELREAQFGKHKDEK